MSMSSLSTSPPVIAPTRSHGLASGGHTVAYTATRTQIYLTDEQRARLSERARTTAGPCRR